MSRVIEHFFVQVFLHIRIFKQSQLKFNAQNIFYSLINKFFRNRTLFNLLPELCDIGKGHHIHIYTRLQRKLGCMCLIRSKSVGYHFIDRCPVAYHKTLKIPFITQHVTHQETIPGHRDPVVVIERGHKGHATRLNPCQKRGKIHISQYPFRKVSAVIIPPSFSRSIAHKVFDTRCQACRITGIGSLIPPYHGHSHDRGKVRVFSESFGNPSPAGIPGNVEHGGKSPAHSCRSGFHGSCTGALFHQFGIECGRQPQGNREYGPESMDHIPAYDQGYAQAGFLYGNFLEGIHPCRIHFVYNGSYMSFAQGFRKLFVFRYVGRRYQGHLSHFFFQGHFG